MKNTNTLHYSQFILIITGLFTAVFNYPVLHKFWQLSFVPHPSLHFFALNAFTFFFIWGALYFLFSLVFGLYVPYFTKPLLAFLCLMSSIVAFSVMTYGTIFDDNMFANIFETNVAESTSYLNARVLGWIFVTGVLPSLWILWQPLKSTTFFRRWLTQWAWGLLSLIIALGIAFSFYKDYATIGRNNVYLPKMITPTYPIYGLEQYIKHTYFVRPMAFKTIGQDAKQLAEPKQKPTLFFLVVGETARTYNYQLNGYDKPTNPFTSAIQNLVSFRHVQSCGTSTAISVPCMFSNMTRANYDAELAHHESNVLDMLQQAGIHLLWKDNDGGSKGVANRIPYISLNGNSDKTLCNGEVCYDMALLKNLKSEITDMPPGNKMVVFHLIGSHGPTYYQRYPKNMAVFAPGCRRSDIENCSKTEITNEYDNTIHYTDYVLSQLIAKLKTYQSHYQVGLLYLSDHGESLGENGLYLHGTPYLFAPKYQTNVPMIAWFGRQFIQNRHLNMTCLQQEALNGHYSQGNLFHSLLGIMNVKTHLYQKKMDIFAQCRNA